MACPTIITTTLPNGTVDVLYNATIVASSSPTPFTFSITSGSLPIGLLFNTNTGVISGNPTTAGTYNFTVTLSPSPGACPISHQAYTIVISASSGGSGGGFRYLPQTICVKRNYDINNQKLSCPEKVSFRGVIYSLISHDDFTCCYVKGNLTSPTAKACGVLVSQKTTYRRKVLVGKIETRLKKLIEQKAKELNVEIGKMEVMPDHVHLFVKARPVHSPQYLVAQFKGFTSHELRKEFPELKSKLPTLWTRSYYVESIGHISEETIKKYIDEQKNK